MKIENRKARTLTNPGDSQRVELKSCNDCRRNRVASRAGVQLSASVPGQLAADGGPYAGVCDSEWRRAAVACDVRSHGL